MRPSALLPVILLAVCSSSFAATRELFGIPDTPSSSHVVQPNFLGISFELAYLDEYFGNNTKTMPMAMLNHLVALRAVTGESPLRLRIGGNSMDTSTYISTQTSPMVQRMTVAANSNNQPVNYGPMVWDVLKQVSSDVGGASFLIGLSLLDTNNPSLPVIAGDASKQLDSSLDGFLLGNEPDLYYKVKGNYTMETYIDDFKAGSSHLTATSAGDITSKREIVGPTLCCFWDLKQLLDDGYLSTFNSELKYLSVQHYPQNYCSPPKHAYDIPYYVQHPNVVQLAQWQNPGIQQVLSTQGGPQVIMSEFNSASCGGVPGVSDSFAAGSLWTIDYALQMAAVGYTAIYIHTREKGVTYNVFDVPDAPLGSPGNWATNPPFYALLVTSEALSSPSGGGSVVVDLDIGNSKTAMNATVSGYGIYDALDSSLSRLVFFNYANTTSSAPAYAEFAIPANTFKKSSTVTMKYLVGDSLTEMKNIGWGGQTFANVGDGRAVQANATWAPPNAQMDCANGCVVRVPSPGMVLVSSEAAAKSVTAHSTLPVSGTKLPATISGSATARPSSGSSVSWDRREAYVLTALSMLIAAVFSRTIG